ncbi:unnamed protein product [Thlaspi arvense]|uniref:Uncharacterized protein n=1 Tax=Thlaspi arvense TaxID=13288 RepID=A0AAU9RS55_THLAR|nr:unnamed protein product [Thlaspi arvense]
MSQSQSLDFSRNTLSAGIPTTMDNLNFLQYLDLSYNDLTGEVPSGTQLKSFGPLPYAGNLMLCGPPLVK